MDPAEYEELFNYISFKKYPSNFSNNQKRQLRRKAENFFLVNNNLYYGKVGSVERFVPLKIKKNMIMRVCHVEGGAHLGRNKTVSKITERYYWNGITVDVKNYLDQCQECQMQNTKAKTAVPEMIPVPVKNKVWSKIGIDLIGPFLNERNEPLSTKGYRYVLTIVDYFSKWPEAVPLYSKKSAEIVDALKETMYRLGVCEEIVSDLGGEFNSSVMTHFTEEFGIKHCTTTPYHPQSNGMCERFNRTLKNMINKTTTSGQQWHEFLGQTLFAYRTSVHESTKVTPFEAVYMRKAVLLKQNLISQNVDSEIHVASEVNDEDSDVLRQIDKGVDDRQMLHEKMATNISSAQKRQKASYDKRHNVENEMFFVGQKVLLKNFRRKKGMGTVMQSRYKGPYVVSSYCGKGTFKLLDSDNNIIGPYNQSSFKKWIEPTLEMTSEMAETVPGNTEHNPSCGINTSVSTLGNYKNLVSLDYNSEDDFQSAQTPLKSFSIHNVEFNDSLDILESMDFPSSDENISDNLDKPKSPILRRSNRDRKRICRKSFIYEAEMSGLI